MNESEAPGYVRILQLEKENARLKEALNLLSTPTCYDLHHPKKYRHEHDEECPVLKRYLELTGKEATK